MNQRCYNPKHKQYKDYGGRGICVCPRWQDSFQCFLADMDKRPDGLTLERRDNDGDYTPENCCWASRKEQSQNQRLRSTSQFIAIPGGGVPKTYTQWSQLSGTAAYLIRERIHRGWSGKEAVFGKYSNPLAVIV